MDKLSFLKFFYIKNSNCHKNSCELIKTLVANTDYKLFIVKKN